MLGSGHGCIDATVAGATNCQWASLAEAKAGCGAWSACGGLVCDSSSSGSCVARSWDSPLHTGAAIASIVYLRTPPSPPPTPPLPPPTPPPPTPPFTCASDTDCSLNGRCVRGGCACIPSWRGAQCQYLRLAPAAPDAGLQQRDASSWGGSILPAADGSGRFHLFAAVFERGCGLKAWRPNSALARATSDGADPSGPYGDVTVIKPHFAHEPVALRAPDGVGVLIYHIGAGANDTGPGSDFATNCSAGCTGPGHHWQPGTTFYGPTSILHGPTEDGPWASLDIGNCSDLPGCTQCGDTNPAPVISDRDGSVRLMWRGSGKGWTTSVMLAASAPRWQGPYAFETTNLFPNFTHTHIEDAHMWLQELPGTGDEYGNSSSSSSSSSSSNVTWHAIFHSDVENACGGAGGGHAWSEDGVAWTFSPFNAYCNTVDLTNGSTVTLRQRERPHLLTDERGWPTHLTNGCGWLGDCDRTFTFVQGIASSSSDDCDPSTFAANVDTHVTAYLKTTAADAPSCCAACSQDAQCDFFSYDGLASANNCHHKQGSPVNHTIARASYTTSGVPAPTPAPADAAQ